MNPIEGLSLRDYFAAHAPEPSLEAIRFELERDRMRNPHNDSYKPPIRGQSEIVAYLKYRYADAMLTERNRP